MLTLGFGTAGFASAGWEPGSGGSSLSFNLAVAADDAPLLLVPVPDLRLSLPFSSDFSSMPSNACFLEDPVGERLEWSSICAVRAVSLS
jgi:hypothetical protein